MLRILLFLLVFNLPLAFSQVIGSQQQTYVCPPCNRDCDSLKFDKPGICNHCNMALINKEELDMHEENKNKKIAFYLQDGVEVLDFAGPMEVFSYAGFKVFTVSKSKEPITSQGILKIIPDYSLVDAPQADILAFFGGNAANAYEDAEVIDWVKQQQGIEYYFSVCTGAFILAEAGILDGKTATTFHSSLDNLEKSFPKIKVLKDVRYVDNGTVVSTAGISAGIDGALHLVAKIQGFNNARRVAYEIEYDKWTPGEGLLLNETDPYRHFMQVENLNEYVGTYEFKDNQKIEIMLNKRENSIYALLDSKSFPLFYLKKDAFMTLNGYEVTFQRNKDNEIMGYRSSEEQAILRQKL
jgi:putative intracellular protease/amidase